MFIEEKQLNSKEAIEILNISLEKGYQPEIEDLNGAVNLGIEALKRLEQNRTLHFIPSLKLLPGETEE